MTGVPAYQHQPWFQVVDPKSGRVVEKSRYDHVQAGWQACVQTRPVGGDLVPQAAAASLGAPPDLNLLVWCCFGVLWVSFWVASNKYFTERQRTIDAMTKYGEQFLFEFRKPLIDPVLKSAPVRAQLHFSPDEGRLEIRLAPADGRRYPNLSDHKENVLYDVGRIVRSLRAPSFICRPIYARGSWVVVPFQFQIGPNKEGAS